MISLGNSLRSPTGDGRITFATNAPSTPYLRSVTVDSFNGDNWAPDDRDDTRRLGTGRMDSGFESAATEVRVVTAVNTGQFTSPYLPAPYAPEAVNGLTGRWSWDPATLSIKGVDTNSRDQQYVVLSVAPQLTPDLLAQATGPVQGVPEQFIRPPDNVPEIVRTTAEAVTAGSTTAYARAMAIQRYLRSVEFTYSLQSPVQGGYDGNGLSVLADFLTQKSGYCIHFASAMAVMARLEGIPSRIAVGYAPGRATGATVSIGGQGALPEYEVDARDAHAWPELYFQGLGWVPFEPTPSRGVVPSYATEAPGPQRRQHERKQRRPPPEQQPQPHAAAHRGAAAAPGRCRPGGRRQPCCCPCCTPPGQCCSSGCCWRPRIWRARALRRRRLNGVRGDGAAASQAWAELRDLATDYGVAPRTSETPRHFSEQAAPRGRPRGTGRAWTRTATGPSGPSLRTSNAGSTAARPSRGRRRPASGPCGTAGGAGAAGSTGSPRHRIAAVRSLAARPCRAAGAVPRGVAAALHHGRLAACRRGAVPRRPPHSTAHPARPRRCLVKDPRGGAPGAPGGWLRRS